MITDQFQIADINLKLVNKLDISKKKVKFGNKNKIRLQLRASINKRIPQG